jgi:hypothetical protein
MQSKFSVNRSDFNTQDERNFMEGISGWGKQEDIKNSIGDVNKKVRNEY